MSRRYMRRAEFNAILAGLRLLQEHLLTGQPHGVLDILTDGNVDCIDPEGIDELCAALNFDEVQLEIEDDEED